MKRRGLDILLAGLFLAVLSRATPSAAFSHIVKPGETLSQIAARVYGDARKETILAGANALDVQGGSAIVPGMRLEIPAPGHHTVVAGDRGTTWRSRGSGTCAAPTCSPG